MHPEKLPIFGSAPDHWITRNSCGLGTGSELRRTAFTSENSAVLAPMPNANDSIAVDVKTRFFFIMRSAKRKS